MNYLTPNFVDALHYEATIKQAIAESARYYDDPEIAALEASLIAHQQLVKAKANLEAHIKEVTVLRKERELQHKMLLEAQTAIKELQQDLEAEQIER